MTSGLEAPAVSLSFAVDFAAIQTLLSGKWFKWCRFAKPRLMDMFSSEYSNFAPQLQHTR